MFRVIPYIMMTIALLFVQIFVLDEISIALVLRPMIVPLVVLLLPIEWRTVWVLLVALATGVLMDVSLGGAGLYTATLLPISSPVAETYARRAMSGHQTPHCGAL